MRSTVLNSLVRRSVFATILTLHSGQVTHASTGNMEFYSLFARALNETCRTGFTSDSEDAREAKGYCMGFLYAVITKMEADGTACFGANISRPIEVAAGLLGNSAEHATSWDVLQKGYQKEFPCS